MKGIYNRVITVAVNNRKHYRRQQDLCFVEALNLALMLAACTESCMYIKMNLPN